MLDAAPDLAARLALGHVARYAVIAAGDAEGHVPVIRGHVLLNRLLERLSLLLNALFHFGAQLLIDPKVLHLKLHIALFLRVNEIWENGLAAYILLNVFDTLARTLVRDALIQLTMLGLLVAQRVLNVYVVDHL